MERRRIGGRYLRRDTAIRSMLAALGLALSGCAPDLTSLMVSDGGADATRATSDGNAPSDPIATPDATPDLVSDRPTDLSPADASCDGPCPRAPEKDCLDGKDDNGDGLTDCDDPTCDDRVTCAPVVGSDSEIGSFSLVGCGGADLVTELQYQGLTDAICGGCTCTTTVTCSTQGLLYQTASDCGSGSFTPIPVSNFDGVDQSNCLDVTSQVYQAVSFRPQTLVLASCAGDGTAVLPNPTWNATVTFCAAARSSMGNCKGDPNLVCVPKPPGGEPLCARTPNSGVCPDGYGSDTGPQRYFTGYQKGSCGSCDCDVDPGAACALSEFFVYSEAGCPQIDLIGRAAGSITGGESCADTLAVGSNQVSIVNQSIASLRYEASGATGTCTPRATAAPSMATGSSVICCQ